jgi:hypothetical protein
LNGFVNFVTVIVLSPFVYILNAHLLLSQFLEKLKEFESQILDDAAKHSEVWFGEEMSREVAKHTFFLF